MFPFIFSIRREIFYTAYICVKNKTFLQLRKRCSRALLPCFMILLVLDSLFFLDCLGTGTAKPLLPSTQVTGKHVNQAGDKLG